MGVVDQCGEFEWEEALKALRDRVLHNVALSSGVCARGCARTMCTNTGFVDRKSEGRKIR